MKKVALIVLLVVVVGAGIAFLIFSGRGTEYDPETLLVGRWELADSSHRDLAQDVIVFREGGTGFVEAYNDGTIYRETFTWNLSEYVLTRIFEETEETIEATIEVTRETLRIEEYVEGVGEVWTEYSRVESTVVVTSFIAYDAVRAIAGQNINLINLLSPGVEMHGYDPTPADLIRIQEADLFIYIGGQTEVWTERVLGTLEVYDTRVIRLMDAVDLIEVEEVEGAEPHDHGHEHSHSHSHDHGEDSHGHDSDDHGSIYDHCLIGYDEHIWTSPANVIRIVEAVAIELILLDPHNAEYYRENADRYIEEIREVQSKVREIVDNRERDLLVFGDRMSMQYFLNEFGLRAAAAFAGCGTETEPSARTIANLVDLIGDENVPVILYLELNQGRIAGTIASDTGIEAIQIQSFHNISRTDYENGETFVSLMTRNLDVLRKALQ
ncbi:MAG: metal ABC transporter substrate-binding protein [Oscillospiraceae bacterium]|nr:metal ABC transporter substrate-binding protein [Oscillospiraceae bacterium]